VRRGLEHQAIHVAPTPVLARLEAAHDCVLRFPEVFGRVFIDRVVAAPDMAAAKTKAEMNPLRADGETFLAPFGRIGFLLPNLIQMRAAAGHGSLGRRWFL
jgi:hypothetical protein